MSNLYAIVARDAPGAAAIRDGARDAHFAHIETILDKVAIAGPLKDAAGHFTGSLVVLHADSEGEARAILEADPYYKAGVWDDIRIDAFTAAAGGWVGGKSW